MSLAHPWRVLERRASTRRNAAYAAARWTATWLLSLALLLSLLSLGFGSGTARAHGGPPAAFGVVAADASKEPSLVLLNEGLAVLRGGTWSFLCPRLWGDAGTSAGKAPLASSVNGIDSWVVGADDLYLARDGVLTAQAQPDFSSAKIVALARADEALFGLSVDASGSAVVRIDAPSEPALFSSPQFWSSLALGGDPGRLHLARTSEQGELVVVTLDRQGQLVEELRSPLEGSVAQLRLRATGGGLFAVTFDGEYYALVRLEQTRSQVLLRGARSIAGPQASAGGQLWVAMDGELMRDAGAGFQAVSEARRVTCLERWGSLSYACVGGEIHALGDAGLQRRLFALDRLSGPDPALVSAEAARDCEFQWVLYRSDLERSGLAPRAFGEPAGLDPADAGGPSTSGPIAGDAAMQGEGAADADEPPVREPELRSGAGCSLGAPSGRVRPPGFIAAIAFAWLALGRSRLRSHPPQHRHRERRE